MPKKQLTIEEKMNNALVPEEEWPYKLPDNWCWVRLGELFQVNPKNNVENDDIEAAFIPMALIDSDFSGEYSYEIKSWKEAKNGHTQFANKDVAFAKISPCFENGKAFIANNLPNGIGAGTTELVVLRNIKIVPQYTFYLLSTDRFVNGGRHTYSGVVGQQRISMDYVKSYAFPLPPLPEQQRIVARIESLFDKLDEAKEKIQNVLDGAESRKAAILHQAFTGKLTAKWRKENGVMDDSWEEVTIKSLCNSLKYGTAKKSAKEGKVPVLRMGNLQNGEIDWTSLVYSNDSDDIRKYSLQNEDVLFNRTNSAELVGKTSIYRGQQPAIYAGYLIKLDYKRDRILGDYLNYVLNSPSAKEYCNAVKTDGVNQSNINAQKIGAFGVRLPKLSEQKEIVRRLDNLLNKEKSICKSCEVSLAAIEAMKKAILAKAFRGELGTNNPAEESSKELLREIISI
ncbi:restriction endonuclease subunit S [Anaerovibrio lipolyticus]|uniref:restriction endonuclease subunit S n=1 Tax=Anaerovibrio lipolyticus TaxID=82374 RepID=UPI0026F031AA|nr:restriction endonuclease subunit S [Anaerovibrio lipolyticus]MBE6106613.1 restriction endonuclease subunit S [Anaerovibrio lipolyticus]